MPQYKAIEICAGAGGQAIGIERAGFSHLAVVEIDSRACATLKLNRPEWNVLEQDIRGWSAGSYAKVDLLAGGLPCPPFSKAGKQLGEDDERNLFPEAIRLINECSPKAVMIENVRGILDSVFTEFRTSFETRVKQLGYQGEWRLFNACDFGVPQLRPRVVFVAMQKKYWEHFQWPSPSAESRNTVGETLGKLMGEAGWNGALDWAKKANEIAPTLVGGSTKHGGADLGPTRSKLAWAKLHVDGNGLADSAPPPGFTGMPRLTVKMAALIQGFPSEWQFAGKKTAAYRQVGNAFPPAVAAAVARQIARALKAGSAIKKPV